MARHHYFRRVGHHAGSLYLFLVTVSDVQGLSYYSDNALCRHLSLDPAALSEARQQLVVADLIAYTKPLYQVLALTEDSTPALPQPRGGQTQSVADILRRALEGGAS